MSDGRQRGTESPEESKGELGRRKSYVGTSLPETNATFKAIGWRREWGMIGGREVLQSHPSGCMLLGMPPGVGHGQRHCLPWRGTLERISMPKVGVSAQFITSFPSI